jgi:hypothetical protein
MMPGWLWSLPACVISGTDFSGTDFSGTDLSFIGKRLSGLKPGQPRHLSHHGGQGRTG